MQIKTCMKITVRDIVLKGPDQQFAPISSPTPSPANSTVTCFAVSGAGPAANASLRKISVGLCLV